jgi:tripartite ATP-independent transporter DctM subunit
MIITIIVVFLALVLLGLDVGFAMIAAAFLGMLLRAGSLADAVVVPLTFVAAVNTSALIPVPMFVLAGELMNRGGVTARLVAWSDAMVGHLRGSLSQVAVLTNLVMAGITGSAIADATATGIALIPAMKAEGYKPSYAGAVIAAAAMLGPILPPSVPMLIYAVIANISVIRLFIAGMLPALLLAAGYMAICAIIARRRNYGAHPRAGWHRRWEVTRGSIWALIMPLLILGFIRSGVVTINESSAALVIYTLLVSVVIYRDLRLSGLIQAIYHAGRTAGVILLLLAAAGPFSWLMSEAHIATGIADAIIGLSHSRAVILLVVNLILLVVGKVLEPLPALVMFIPALVPVQAYLGVDPIQFGVIVILNLMIGMQTPPIGLLLFVVSAIGDIPLWPVIVEIVPFVIWSLVVLALVTIFPWLTLWLPALIGG